MSKTLLKKRILPLAIPTLIAVLISLGVERELLFWEWDWKFIAANPHSLFTPRKVASGLATIATCLAMLCCLSVRCLPWKILFSLLLWVGIGYVGFFVYFEDRMPAYRDMQITFDGLEDFFGFGITIFHGYGLPIIVVLLAAALITAELWILGSRLAFRRRIVALAGIVAYFLCIGFYVFFPNGDYSAPLYVKTPVLLLTSLRYKAWHYVGPRSQPILETTASEEFRSHIVFVMDESISGFALGINGFPYNTTPKLLSRTAPPLFNYGICSSAGNFSSITNIIVLSGLRTDQIPDYDQRMFRQATVFSYAQHAGRKTYYIDAQNAELRNFMGKRDMATFEHIVIPGFVPAEEEAMKHTYFDRKAIDRAAEIMRSASEPVFIFILKTGAHVPYHNKHPYADSHPELRTPEGDAIRSDYLKCVKWAVDDFFEYTAEKLAGLDVNIVYTGDHGQNLDYRPGTTDPRPKRRYGSLDEPSQREVNVPLMIWSNTEKALDEFNRLGGYREDAFGRSTQFQLFPTLLLMMGYDKDEVRENFGGSLFDPPPPQRWFTTRFPMPGEPVTTWLFDFDQTPE